MNLPRWNTSTIDLETTIICRLYGAFIWVNTPQEYHLCIQKFEPHCMIYSRVKTALVNTEMSLTYIGPHCWKQKFGQCSSSGLLRVILLSSWNLIRFFGVVLYWIYTEQSSRTRTVFKNIENDISVSAWKRLKHKRRTYLFCKHALRNVINALLIFVILKSLLRNETKYLDRLKLALTDIIYIVSLDKYNHITMSLVCCI